MKKIWEDLEQMIMERYHISGQEWVQVDLSARGKIHTTIVSDSHISKEEIQHLVSSKINESQEEYSIGYIDIYSIEKAAEYNITKTAKKSGYASWSDALYANETEISSASHMQIISFYSYKGGVGRTIALIQTAYNLAKVGKRVLLMDLDIEAPSLHNIFSKQVNHPVNGVKYGIIEYLYRKIVQLQHDVAIEHTFCSLELQNIPGEIYLIPALKKMSKDYIYQMEKLQTLQVQEQKTFKDIFDYIRTVLNIDTVMVDTRAGFNKWGSLSLLTLSDQVIFVAFANSENIEGLNLAFELFRNVGKTRYAVAMSKVVPSEEGMAKARVLFSDLHIPQEQLIPIYYKEEVALNSQYPITEPNISEAYATLSEYILNNERIDRNRQFLANGIKQQMLRNLFQADKKLVSLMSVRRFQFQKASSILKYTYSEELYGLKSEMRNDLERIGQVLAAVPTYIFIGINHESDYESLLSERWENPEEAGIKLMEAIIANSEAKEKNIIPKGKKNISEVLACLKTTLTPKDILIIHDNDTSTDLNHYDVISNLKIIVSISEKMLERNAPQVIENIQNLIGKFNQETPSIQFKFLVQAAAFDKYQELFTGLKGNVLDVSIEEDDIRRFLMLNFNPTTLKPYQEYSKKLQLVPNEREMVIRLDDDFIAASELNETIGLVLGIRQDAGVYSPSVIEYLYDRFLEQPQLKYDYILDMLKTIAEQELQQPNNTYSDRLIPFDKLQTTLDTKHLHQKGGNP